MGGGSFTETAVSGEKEASNVVGADGVGVKLPIFRRLQFALVLQE